MLLNQNFGHNPLTALNNYCYDEEGSHTRLDMFEPGYRFILARDSLKGFSKDISISGHCNCSCYMSHSVFGDDELLASKQKI